MSITPAERSPARILAAGLCALLVLSLPAEGASQGGDVHLDGVSGGRRRILRPQLVDDAFRRHGPFALACEQRQECALVPATDRDRLAADAHF